MDNNSMKHIILCNPKAGKHRGKKYAERLKILLKRYNIESSIYESKSFEDLTTITKELEKEHKTRFYSIGGDGTINAIIQSLVNSESELVVLPLGTGNDFVKSISKYQSMRKNCYRIIKKRSN